MNPQSRVRVARVVRHHPLVVAWLVLMGMYFLSVYLYGCLHG